MNKLGDAIEFGKQKLHALATPGHTNGCMSYVSHTAKCVMTGDALLIRGCGRTDFQQGSSDLLYESIHKKIFSLPDEYTIFPGHDYKGRINKSLIFYTSSNIFLITKNGSDQLAFLDFILVLLLIKKKRFFLLIFLIFTRTNIEYGGRRENSQSEIEQVKARVYRDNEEP